MPLPFIRFFSFWCVVRKHRVTFGNCTLTNRCVDGFWRRAKKRYAADAVTMICEISHSVLRHHPSRDNFYLLIIRKCILYTNYEYK